MVNPRRHANDPFSQKARKEGLVARSAFKLREISQRQGVFKGVHKVLDLGAAPGSWTVEASRRVGPKGLVVAVDLQPMRARGARDNLVGMEADVYALEAEAISEACGGRAPPFDLVMSDMAPNTTGSRDTDHLAQISLAERALHLALELLRPGGTFLCKVFDGADAQSFVQSCEAAFGEVKRLRPKAVRSQSREFYVLAKGRLAPDAPSAEE